MDTLSRRLDYIEGRKPIQDTVLRVNSVHEIEYNHLKLAAMLVVDNTWN